MESFLIFLARFNSKNDIIFDQEIVRLTTPCIGAINSFEIGSYTAQNMKGLNSKLGSRLNPLLLAKMIQDAVKDIWRLLQIPKSIKVMIIRSCIGMERKRLCDVKFNIVKKLPLVW